MNGRSDTFDTCIAAGGVVLFPADTVYGLACDAENGAAIERLYALKRRPAGQAAAVMFFTLEAALGALGDLGPRTRAALARLLPGPVTALLPNPTNRFPLACRADPATLGVRVVEVAALAGARSAVLQSSANLSGQPAPRRLEDVVPEIAGAVELIIDGGELPGVASTVVDLREYEGSGAWKVVRAGALGPRDLSAALVSSNGR